MTVGISVNQRAKRKELEKLRSIKFNFLVFSSKIEEIKFEEKHFANSAMFEGVIAGFVGK